MQTGNASIGLQLKYQNSGNIACIENGEGLEINVNILFNKLN